MFFVNTFGIQIYRGRMNFLNFLHAAQLENGKLKVFDKNDLTALKLNFRLFQFEVKSLFNYEVVLKKLCLKIYNVENEMTRNR